MVENLVKNWEIEASFKTSLDDWRTVDTSSYTFSLNGGPKNDGNHMLSVGTYNALIGENKYYDPEQSSFDSSHKSFKRMMPVFAWEVIEVYSGPPTVTFKWRHWGQMKNDYVGFNSCVLSNSLFVPCVLTKPVYRKGEKVKVKAHGGMIDFEGIVVAKVNDALKLESIEVWYDPMIMFRQIDRENTMEIVPPAGSAAGGCPVAH